MSFPKLDLIGANNSFQQVNCLFQLYHVWAHWGHWRLLACLQCPKALWVLSESLKGAAQIMADSSPLGEGGKPWNTKIFEDFQNIQYQILDEGQCVSTWQSFFGSLACLSFVCFLTCLFADTSSLQLTYKDTSDALASYFSNVAATIQQQVHLFFFIWFVYFS